MNEDALVDLLGRWLSHHGPDLQTQDLAPVLTSIMWSQTHPDTKARFKEQLRDVMPCSLSGRGVVSLYSKKKKERMK